MMILQIIVMISIIIMSVLGNLLVLISVLCNRALRQPPNLLLLSLAVTDMLVSLLDKEAEAAHALLEDLEVTMLREAEELERDSARSTRGIPSGLRSRRSKIRD